MKIQNLSFALPLLLAVSLPQATHAADTPAPTMRALSLSGAGGPQLVRPFLAEPIWAAPNVFDELILWGRSLTESMTEGEFMPWLETSLSLFADVSWQREPPAPLEKSPFPELTTPVDGVVSSPFGDRIHPITHRAKLHAGIDFAAKRGTPVRAAAPGRVVTAKRVGGYGNMIVIEHDGGARTRYAHLSSMSVRSGTEVLGGQRIGRVGSTGFATGAHLHFELRKDGEPFDPGVALVDAEHAH